MRSFIALTTIIAVLAALVSAAPSLGFDIFHWIRLPSSADARCMTTAERETTGDSARMLLQDYSHKLMSAAPSLDFDIFTRARLQSSWSSHVSAAAETFQMLFQIYINRVTSATTSLGVNMYRWARPEPSSDERCMTPDEAETAADIFRMLIQEYSHELAQEALTEDFVDWASSVNIIINKGAAGPKSMDKPTFASRAAFIDGQGKQPQIPFTKIKVWPGCRHVAMRWKTGKSANGHLTEVDDIPVHGHVIIDVVPAEVGNRFNWRIKNIFSEFNSGAWLVNLGVFKPTMLPNADDVRHMREFKDDSRN